MPGSKKLNAASKAFVPGGPSGGTSKTSKPVPSPAPPSPAPSEPKKAPEAVPKPASKPAAVAWGSKPLDAVRAAPPPSFAAAAAASSSSSLKAAASKPKHTKAGHGKQWGNRSNSGDNHSDHRTNHQQQHGRKNQRQNSGGGRRGGHDNHSNGSAHRNQHHNRSLNSNHSNNSNRTFVIVELCKPGDGTTEEQKSVQRFSFDDLLSVRMEYLDPPANNWNPPEACEWCAENRKDEITSKHVAPRQGGDVSIEKRHSKKKVIDTAPALEDCKPLKINDETRWKAKVMTKDKVEDDESDEAVLKKALLILNKLSLTKFEKLSDEFIETGIGKNKACLEGAIGLIVNKAQTEPHFANMYAQLCFKLAQEEFEFEDGSSSKKKKVFKKLLLSRCQEEFELDTARKIAKATEGVTDAEEIDYHVTLIRKSYLGHMRFIGELYKGDMIKIDIMLWCLQTLLTGEEGDSERSEKKDAALEEEKVECFSKLMSTIGASLENQSLALNEAGKSQALEKLNGCWHTVEVMAGRKKDQSAPQVTKRVKFMMQDLLEMRDKGWITRRKEETAKTIEQIHQEAAKEERKAARRSSSSGSLRSLGPRRASAGDVRILDRRDSKKGIADRDGFVQIPSKKTPALSRSVSDVTSSRSSGFKNSKPKRSGSFGKKESQPKTMIEEIAQPSLAEQAEVEFPSPDTCGKKAESIFKEYFVGGDTEEAILSINEVIGMGNVGAVERGSKVVESSILLVMERKETDVSKMLAVLTRCIKESKLDKESLILGLKDPLEFLSDIVVDAPLADSHLATIVTTLIQIDALSFDFLLSAPEYFRTGGNAAQFAAKVLQKLGGEEQTLAANVGVVEQLMTAEEKESHASANDLIGD